MRYTVRIDEHKLETDDPSFALHVMALGRPRVSITPGNITKERTIHIGGGMQIPAAKPLGPN